MPRRGKLCPNWKAPHRLDRLVVTFHRGGKQIERETASSGERALKLALLALARLDYMEPGDTLRCIADDTGVDGKPLPPPRAKQ